MFLLPTCFSAFLNDSVELEISMVSYRKMFCIWFPEISFKTLHQFRGRAAVASLSLLTSPSSDECVDDLQLCSVGLWHVVVHNLSQHRADKHWIWGGSALWCCVVFFHPQGGILRERWGCKHSCCLQELFTSGCFTDRFIHGQIYTDAFRKVVVMHVQFAKTNRQTPSTYLYMKPNL